MSDPSRTALRRREQFSPARCLTLLNRYEVSAHYVITRRGHVIQLVDEQHRAWHAGKSRMPFRNDRRSGVNRFSIGIELIGTPTGAFTTSQYKSLVRLVLEILRRHRITSVVGHEHIAPGRKIDPGPAFDWKRFGAALRTRLGTRAPRLAGQKT